MVPGGDEAQKSSADQSCENPQESVTEDDEEKGSELLDHKNHQQGCPCANQIHCQNPSTCIEISPPCSVMSIAPSA